MGSWDATERSGAMAQVTPDAVKRFPRILGADGAGTVVAIGADVTGFHIGDEVYAAGYLNPKGGFYAQYAAVAADHVALVPSGLKLEEAGVLAVTGATALRGLSDHLKLKASEHLLVFAAAGGVGQPAVQLARAMGAHVLAVVSDAEGAAVAKESGADVVINSKADDVKVAVAAFAPAGLDAVLVLVNGDGLNDAIAGVRAGGRVAYPHGVQPVPTGRPDIEVIGYDGTPGREVLDRLSALVAARSQFISPTASR